MARAPKMASGKISLARGIHRCPNVFISLVRPTSVYCEAYVFTYTYPTAKRPYMNYRCYQITLPVKHFYTNQECCEVLAGCLSLGRRPGGDWANV